MCRILELKESFIQLSFSHIYREFNKEADVLSKEAAGHMDGLMHFEEYVENLVIDK